MNKKIFSPNEKAAVAWATIKGDKTFAEISSAYQVHETQIRRWKQIAETNFVMLFGNTHQKIQQEQGELIQELYRIIGKRNTELEWLKKNYISLIKHHDRKALIDGTQQGITLTRQAELLSISRSSMYYTPRGEVSEEEKKSMNVIDTIYTECPF